ncbi:MAG: hypothetical protein J5507_00100 [Clostridia bacterium]|nr:hypothetical protein [Clostridia bacterium]
MSKLKYILKEKRMLIALIAILLICSIAIAIAVYAQVTNKGVKIPESEKVDVDYEELKNNFQDIFTNTINKEDTAKLNINYDELLYTRFNIKDEKNGKYTIEARLPGFKEDSEVLQKINQEIFDIFAKEMLRIGESATSYTTFNLDYVGYVNNNIISLAIMCKYKDGTKAQRKIVKCYNYDIENDKLLSIEDIIEYKKLDKNKMQKKVNEEIKKINKQMKNISDQGYNVFLREEESEIYKIENTENFFLGRNNYLYLVYAYGNNNYTSEIDLVIF